MNKLLICENLLTNAQSIINSLKYIKSTLIIRSLIIITVIIVIMRVIVKKEKVLSVLVVENYKISVIKCNLK